MQADTLAAPHAVAGPLGQGLANAVGMALAERILAEEFNRPGLEVVDHRTWAFVGDGCLMEGISHEAASLAGTLGLDKLVCLYDDNGISIDGDVSGWFTDDTPARFEAYGWRVLRDVDGHDPERIAQAIAAARERCGRPTLVCCRTVIGKGAPGRAGSHEVHGAPLGEKEVAAARAHLGWTHPPFEIPADLAARLDARARGAAAERRWDETFDAYARAHPALAAELRRRLAGDLPAALGPHLDRVLERIVAKRASIATRKAEHAAALRLIPGMDVWRPADAVETVVAWRAALERRDGPSCLLLTRQAVPFQPRDAAALGAVGRGGYVLSEAEGAPAAVILATGSEVALAVEAQRALAAEGVPVRVVSMPCTSAFDRQEPAYRGAVLPPGVPRVAVEAGVGDPWRKYVGLDGAVVGIDRFGESAPAAELARHLGLTPERVAQAVRQVLARA
jgi:transketolase